MAIREVTMHQGVCDGCDKTMADMGSDYWAWTDESSVLEDMDSSDWVTPGAGRAVTVAGPHLCPSCAPDADEDPDCPHDSRSGDAGGRWRCDQCGTDCGPNTYLSEEESRG
ncbi:hypothetical protein [Nocardia ignorata]|uniref:Uncharacterized protein n=1 Tax=Nocardia ignorata TaxID=145285 RepID=A0A4R6NZ26_NOCIG|nr:hypothetical protein [Nocardia ignorata]TDP29793.1 hypothetical protein DFR75_11261 [Nocardia ignorata]